MALDGVRGDVTQVRVSGLLQQRRPTILDDTEPAEVAKFETIVRGAAVTVVLLVGENPEPGLLRDLAAEAIALETASQIEYAEFPEQQVPGDQGRGFHLHERYLELLAQIRGYVESGTVSGAVGVPRPVGSFPAARDYPDPAEVVVRPCSW